MAFRTYDFIKDSILIDYASATVIYYGLYVPPQGDPMSGSVDTSQPIFLIQRETLDLSGRPITLKWACRAYSQVWDDRATINYY